MSLMESKMVQVNNDPNTINEMSQTWGSFGWSVLSTQITHSRDSRTFQDWYQYGTNSCTTETTTINYATITFQRDKKMENYAEIKALEDQYTALKDEMDSKCEEIMHDDTKLIFNPIALLNPLNYFKHFINFYKKIFGIDTLSRSADEKMYEVYTKYTARLEEIRQQAEALL